jgi:tRNA (guanine37-N1)-methyltransferase
MTRDKSRLYNKTKIIMQFGIITLFPEIVDCLNHSIPGRAIQNKLITLQFWNPRDFTTDKHRTVDDRPYGGGPGMLMKVEPLKKAIEEAKKVLPQAKTIYLSPQGKTFNQQAAQAFSQEKQLILVSGRYEGIDERLIETCIDEEWSIGDYVLSGGELAAAVMLDSIIRLLPGVLGDEQSADQDSFMQGLLDNPHYTRPEKIDERHVPEVLLRGNHAAIARWRLKQALGRTWLRRPDLLEKRQLSAEEQSLLNEFMIEQEKRNEK